MTTKQALCSSIVRSSGRRVSFLKHILACSLFTLSLLSLSTQLAHAAGVTATSAGVDSTVNNLPIAVQGIAGITLYAAGTEPANLAANPAAPDVFFNGPIKEGPSGSQTIINTDGSASFATTVAVAGNTTLNTATITNAATLKSTLSVAGISTFTGAANFTTAAFSGATNFSGVATFNDGLSATNGIYTDTITIGSGATLATLGYNQAKTLVNLSAMACTSNQALTETSTGAFYCVNVADIPLVGKTVVPTCPAGQQIYFDASGFSCQPFIPNCSGEYVSSNGSSFTCAAAPAIPAVPAVPNCAPGQYLTANGSSFSCYSPPAGGQPIYIQTASSVGQDQFNQYLSQNVWWYCIPKAEAQGLSAAAAQTYCMGYYTNCAINYGGTNGNDNGTVNATDTADWVAKTSNITCMSAYCQGATGIAPSLVYETGACSPGQTSGNTGNPGCTADGRPLLVLSCLYPG